MIARRLRRWRHQILTFALTCGLIDVWYRIAYEQAGAVGDIKRVYASSSDQTVTNLHSLPTSSTYINGWESNAIDNGTNLYEDYSVRVKITVAAAGLSAGQIRVYVAAMLDDSNWPGNLDGTESVEAPFFVDTEQQAAWMKLAAVSDTDTGASDPYWLDCPSVAALFGGNLPHKFVILISHSTGANLAASGNQVTIKGSYRNVA